MDNIITVKSSKGLNSLMSGNGETVSAKLYSQEDKDRDKDGKFVADYDNKPFPNSKKFLSPKWDALRKQWPWGGGATKFKEVVTDLMLRYPKNHAKSGQIIIPGDVEKHKKDFKDPIFHHPDLISKCYIQGGSGTLNLEIPIEAFMYYSNRSLREVSDETTLEGKKINPAQKASATFVFSNPSRTASKNRIKTDLFLDALGVVIENKTNVDKLRMMAVLFDIPGLSRKSDANEIVPTITEYIKEYGDKIQRGSGYASLNEAIIAHNAMTEDEIQHRYVIKVAKKKGHIRTSKDGFLLFNRLVEGPKSMDDIYHYFSGGGDKSTEDFVALLEKMREFKEID